MSENINRAFRIRLNKSGLEFEVPADKSILEVLRENSYHVDSSCEVGACGTCLTPVLEGEMDHRDKFLTEEEHATNEYMTVCCSRAITDLLVLDI